MKWLALFLTFSAPALATDVQIWHQMMYSHREVLREAADRFETSHPGVKITLVYRETEDLRSAFQTAVLGGSGPALIHGPADQVGPFAAMNLLRPLDDLIPLDLRPKFDPAALVRRDGRLFALADVVGSHLMLLHNRKLLPEAPRNTEDLRRFCRKEKQAGRWCIAWNRNEPFFFVPWIPAFGGEIFTSIQEPRVNTPAMIKALQFAAEFTRRGWMPPESDYEISNALFLEGKVPLLINGEWAWGDYLKAGIDLGVAPLPLVSETGLTPRALTNARGYSVNRNVRAENLPLIRELLLYLTGEEVQVMFLRKVGQLPSLLSISGGAYPELARDARLRSLMASMRRNGIPMPIDPEIRAYWDATRPMVQTVLSGAETAEKGAERAQKEVERQIAAMNEVVPAGAGRLVVFAVGLVFLVLVVLKARASWPGLRKEWNSTRRIAYVLMLPAAAGMALVVVYPFLYNLVISVSNLSIRTFDTWQIVGFVHYRDVLFDAAFWVLLGKSVIWTGVNIFFHMVLGVTFALLVNESLPARPLFRALLILPWAVPSYITALVWRSMFNQEYGAINQALVKLLHLPPVEWLSRPMEAFSACILTNIWLGFPFIMVVTLGGLQAIPASLYEAARLDGAHALQRFRRITWPLLQPVLRPSLILGAIWTFNSLHVLWLVSNGGEPADSTHILASQVYKSAFVLYRYGHGAALSMVNFALLLVLAAFYLRSQRHEEEAL
ncbi:MAG: extracellular solute-binding protein [Bdellovibrionales bacterium]|nr:extracellular solute-binding protein [Bdellovibrionales bacterium]